MPTGSEMLRVVCFHCADEIPRPFAARPEILELARASFGPEAHVVYENRRPVVRGADGGERALRVEESFSLSPGDVLWKLCKNPGPVTLRFRGTGAYLSVAHSGAMAVCALSSLPVGVDVEPMNRETRELRRSFSEEEQAYCRLHEGECPCPELVIFTRKEAVMKGSGQATFCTYRALKLAENGALRQEEKGLRLCSFLVGEYLVSVAARTSLQTVEKKIFSPSTEKIGKG